MPGCRGQVGDDNPQLSPDCTALCIVCLVKEENKSSNPIKNLVKASITLLQDYYYVAMPILDASRSIPSNQECFIKSKQFSGLCCHSKVQVVESGFD